MNNLRNLQSIALCWLLISGLGCGIKRHGASTVPPARFNYNEAIVESQDQQMLLNLVRVKNGATTFYLDVDKVNVSYTYSGNAKATFGLKTGKQTVDDGTTETVTIPQTPDYGVEAGGSYTQSPTITYQPLKGVEFANRMLSPILPANLVGLVETGWDIRRVLDCCVQRINELKNAVVFESVVQPRPEQSGNRQSTYLAPDGFTGQAGDKSVCNPQRAVMRLDRIRDSAINKEKSEIDADENNKDLTPIQRKRVLLEKLVPLRNVCNLTGAERVPTPLSTVSYRL